MSQCGPLNGELKTPSACTNNNEQRPSQDQLYQAKQCGHHVRLLFALSLFVLSDFQTRKEPPSLGGWTTQGRHCSPSCPDCPMAAKKHNTRTCWQHPPIHLFNTLSASPLRQMLFFGP
jgi:hypothetical protein